MMSFKPVCPWPQEFLSVNEELNFNSTILEVETGSHEVQQRKRKRRMPSQTELNLEFIRIV